jgi:hypothetical protein
LLDHRDVRPRLAAENGEQGRRDPVRPELDGSFRLGRIGGRGRRPQAESVLLTLCGTERRGGRRFGRLRSLSPANALGRGHEHTFVARAVTRLQAFHVVGKILVREPDQLEQGWSRGPLFL